ncbi:hypothetical protein COLO4_29160 [Corchorus olitorius]|uniref:Transmembrane protein n=1 Tax=Corchorus olitorius TaxID=93759 RepID=A0A1R3HFZ4_9ROSI|nr:hypothetical protein COLO4_29160 [Corchorus olitorius]
MAKMGFKNFAVLLIMLLSIHLQIQPLFAKRTSPKTSSLKPKSLTSTSSSSSTDFIRGHMLAKSINNFRKFSSNARGTYSLAPAPEAASYGELDTVTIVFLCFIFSLPFVSIVLVCCMKSARSGQRLSIDNCESNVVNPNLDKDYSNSHPSIQESIEKKNDEVHLTVLPDEPHPRASS